MRDKSKLTVQSDTKITYDRRESKEREGCSKCSHIQSSQLLACAQPDKLSGDTCSNLCVDRRSVTLNMSKRSLLTVGQLSVSSSLTERLTICFGVYLLLPRAV